MQTVLITGGSKGIGHALVKRLASDGWQVAFSYLNSRQEAQNLCHDTGALAFRADMQQEAQVQQLAADTIKAFGHLDALVYNAGISYWGLTQEMSRQSWDMVQHINLRGAFFSAKAVMDHMIVRKTGSILFVSSVWGQRGAACESAYAASKAGMIGLSQSLAAELGPCGIRVNCIAPGVINTGMLDGFTNDELEQLRQRCCLKQLGKPEDVAAAAAFLLSQQASYITGQTLTVDGGFI